MNKQKQTMMQKLRAFLHVEDIQRGGKEIKTFASGFLAQKKTTKTGVVYEKSFRHPKHVGSLIRDGKYMYRVITAPLKNGEQHLLRMRVK